MHRTAPLALLVVAALAACSSERTGPAEGALVRRQETLFGGLRHRVDVTLRGDTATIRSVVENATAAPIEVTTRMCGLDVDPNVPWADDGRCGGYSMHSALAPGDSIVEADRRIVDRSRASLRVRHLLSPDVWTTVTLR